MANVVAIKKEQHQNLKLANKRSLGQVTGQHILPVTAAEYAQAATSFPVVLIKEPNSERYRSVVMLGLEGGENLFYQDDKWVGLYIPQGVGMAPFALGLDPDKENTLTACVDLDSEFVGEDKELPLFDDKGEETEVFLNVQKSLGRLYDNEVASEKFIKELESHDLIHELELNMSLSTGENKKLVGIYTVNEDKLKTLSDELILDFHKRGLFVPIHAMLGSLGQLNRLIQLRNDSSETKISGIQILPVKAEEKK